MHHVTTVAVTRHIDYCLPILKHALQPCTEEVDDLWNINKLINFFVNYLCVFLGHVSPFVEIDIDEFKGNVEAFEGLPDSQRRGPASY